MCKECPLGLSAFLSARPPTGPLGLSAFLSARPPTGLKNITNNHLLILNKSDGELYGIMIKSRGHSVL